VTTPKARDIYQRAKATAQKFKRLDAELLRAIREVEDHRIYIEYGCRSLSEFCVKHLELAPNVAFNFITVMRTSKKVPELARAVEDGLALTRARRLAAVITPENHAHWFTRARELPLIEFERALATENPRLVEIESARPTAADRNRIEFFVSNDGVERLRRAQELIANQRGRPATWEETITAAVEVLIAAKDPVQRARRNQGRKNASLRTKVFARDQGRCQMKTATNSRCGSRKFPHLHHKHARFNGGLDHPDNLVTLCATCHRAWHLKHGDVPLYGDRPREPDG
jgi:hypothetical protein